MKPARRALIIDDEKQIRRLLRIALEEAGHQVEEAETGQAGLAEIVQRRPDVVLLDLGLPDMQTSRDPECTSDSESRRYRMQSFTAIKVVILACVKYIETGGP